MHRHQLIIISTGAAYWVTENRVFQDTKCVKWVGVGSGAQPRPNTFFDEFFGLLWPSVTAYISCLLTWMLHFTYTLATIITQDFLLLSQNTCRMDKHASQCLYHTSLEQLHMNMLEMYVSSVYVTGNKSASLGHGGVMVRTMDLWSTGCVFDSRPCTAKLVLGREIISGQINHFNT